MERPPVQTAPPPVLHSLDLVGDDDVRVKLRVTHTRVPMVVRRRNDPDDVCLRHGTITSVHSPPGRRDLTFQEGEHFGQRLVVGLEDERLSSRVGNAPIETDFGTLKVKS